MECYYNILEVPKDASDDDIKKSYKKLALKYHPDKNLDNVKESTEKFKEIQRAYSVLRDFEKRKLYDNGNEDDIIIINNYDSENNINEWDKSRRSHNHNHPNYYRFNFPKKYNIHNPFKYIRYEDLRNYLNTDWFTGYLDNSNGFYTMCRKLFEKLSLEVLSRPGGMPTFGKSTSNYEDVVAPFYKVWNEFLLNPRLFNCPCAAFKRYSDIVDIIEFIEDLDERIQRHIDLKMKPVFYLKSKKRPLKLKAKVKVRKCAGNTHSSRGEKPEFYKYEGSVKHILHEMGDYDDVDYQDDQSDDNEDLNY